jgi:UDP-N-acetylmuramate-alanine ligase
LLDEILQLGHKQAYFETDLAKVPSLVAGLARPNDMILVLGAGNINRTIPRIAEELETGK